MNRALLVIDVQNEYFTGKLPVTHPPGSLEKIGNAMDAASVTCRVRIAFLPFTEGKAEGLT